MYIDPPDRTQGSGLDHGSMQGVLGLIWQRVCLENYFYYTNTFLCLN